MTRYCIKTIKVTATVRNAVRAILDASSCFDAGTMVIGRDGLVSALKDANKTFNGPETMRWMVGYVADMVRQNGTVIEDFRG